MLSDRLSLSPQYQDEVWPESPDQLLNRQSNAQSGYSSLFLPCRGGGWQYHQERFLLYRDGAHCWYRLERFLLHRNAA